MFKKNQSLILTIIVIIIVISLILTTAIAIKGINDENNRFIINNDYPENSYKVGTLGDMVISILYQNEKRTINVYYYNENDEFTYLRYFNVFKNRSDAMEMYTSLYNEKNTSYEELYLYRNVFTYVVKAEYILDDKIIELNKQELIDKIKEEFDTKGYTEIK